MNKYIKDKKMMIRWVVIILIIIATIFGIKFYANSVYNKEFNKSELVRQDYEKNLKDAINKSSKSSYDLTLMGKKMIEANQTQWAIVVLEAAAAKDPKYRDAALFTGYAYLHMADEIRSTKSEARNNSTISTSEAIQQYNNSAIEYLKKAETIDPIYAETQQLLAIAYNNIGDAKNSSLCYNKFKDFSKK